MTDFFKILLERLRIDILLASLAVAVLLYKLMGFDAWWMVFVFCLTALSIMGVEKGIKKLSDRREFRRQEEKKRVKQQLEDDELNEQVWQHFYTLDGQSLELVKKVYYSEKDPSNPYVRYIQDGGVLAYQIDKDPVFRVYDGDRCYYPLLNAEHIGNATVVTFMPYYLDLVKRYVDSGKKERVVYRT